VKRLEDKVIVIAGGATGIGRATARRAAGEGARVLIGDIDDTGAAEAAALIEAAGGTALACQFDLSDEASCQQLIEMAVEQWGAIDGLYNVGADLSEDTLGRDTDIVSVPNEVLWRTLEVDLLGYVFTSRYAIPHMLAAGGGSIVHTTSAVTLGQPRFCSYAIAKNGVIALSRHIAAQWGKQGIRSNAIDPGITMTDNQKEMNSNDQRAAALSRVRSSRFGEPEEIAAMVAFLLSSESRWINGQTYGVSSQDAAR
jgi:NAD(P)-dependent dehydrogenase (short-subunit alcohol dehydrogenase family)